MIDKEELIRKLAIQSPLSHRESAFYVNYIFAFGGTVEKMNEVYESQGIRGLDLYLSHLKIGVYY